MTMREHPALTEGRVAVVTGAAGGIGLSAAKRFASMGLRICLADLGGTVLEQAAAEVASGADPCEGADRRGRPRIAQRRGLSDYAHLLVPGSTFTAMTRRDRTTKPPGSWTPEQVIGM